MPKKYLVLFASIAVVLVGVLTVLQLFYRPQADVLGVKSWKKRSIVKVTNTPVASVTMTLVATTTVKPTGTSKPTATPTRAPSPTATVKPTVTAIATPSQTSSGDTKKWGYYTGWSVDQVKALENKVGKVGNYIATFVHWGNEKELPIELGNLAKLRGQTLVIFWEAMDYNFSGVEDKRFSYDAILRGDWNTYLTSFANQTKSFGGQVILIPFEEMNGNWYPWSGTVNGNSPAKHIATYRFVRGFFRDAPNVKFGWTINSLSEPNVAGNQVSDYYPGDEYVDVLGVNGFNFGSPWVSFANTFKDGFAKLETMNKPIVIFSMACAPGTEKGNWIREGLGQEIYKHPKVEGWIWFNENKEKDWRIWSSADSLEAFKKVIE